MEVSEHACDETSQEVSVSLFDFNTVTLSAYKILTCSRSRVLTFEVLTLCKLYLNQSCPCCVEFLSCD